MLVAEPPRRHGVERQLLTTLASSLSVALENARLFDETQRLLTETNERAAELAIINSVQQGLAERARLAVGTLARDGVDGVEHVDEVAGLEPVALVDCSPMRILVVEDEDTVRTLTANVLKNAGYKIYHPNFEVWDRELFSWICPGKERYVGRDEWMKRIVDAALEHAKEIQPKRFTSEEFRAAVAARLNR